MTPELWVAVISGAFAFAGVLVTVLGKRRADADARRTAEDNRALAMFQEVQEERDHERRTRLQVEQERDDQRDACDELRRRLRDALDQIEVLLDGQRDQARLIADKDRLVADKDAHVDRLITEIARLNERHR